MSTVGQKIKEFREAMGLTQEELAGILSMADVTVSRYEKGKRQVNADDLPRLASALRVSPTAFFEEPSPHRAGSPARLLPVLADMGYDLTDLERDTITEFADALVRYRKRLLDEQAG